MRLERRVRAGMGLRSATVWVGTRACKTFNLSVTEIERRSSLSERHEQATTHRAIRSVQGSKIPEPTEI